MSSLYSVTGLLTALEAVGARLELKASGDGVRVVADVRPSDDLMQAARQLKPDLLAYLTGQTAEVEAVAATLSSPDDVNGHDLPTASQRPGKAKPTPEEWAAIAARPGRCGSCARSKPAAPEWGPGMVVCTADPVAWWPMSEPFAMTETALCGAYLTPGEEMGQGWRAKPSGKTWGALPLSSDDSAASGAGTS